MSDLVNIVSQRKAMFDAAALKKNVKLLFDTNRDSYVTAIDELKIEKVVDNLISNAIKYSHPGGEVDINLICDTNQWMLEVRIMAWGFQKKRRKTVQGVLQG